MSDSTRYSTSISISECNNELYLIACNDLSSYQIGHIQSDSEESVNVVLEIKPAAEYVQPATLQGINHSIAGLFKIGIPPGRYRIMVVAISWGGMGSAALGISYEGNQENFASPSKPGSPLPNVFWTNGGAPLTMIEVN